MDIEKHLILIKGEDKTKDITYCKKEGPKWQVKFGTNSRAYPYSKSNVLWLKAPLLLPESTSIVYENNYPLSGINKIFDFGAYIRICFVNGDSKVYDSRNITIEESCLLKQSVNSKFEYLKELAKKVGENDREESSFLSKQYEKIIKISSHSVLKKYLDPSKLKKPLGACRT